LATLTKTTDTASAKSFLEQGRQLGENLKDKSFLGRNLEIRGEMHSFFGQYDLAIIEFDRALAYYYEADDDAGYYETLKDKGNVYLFMSEYPQAMNYYETALEYYRRSGNAEGASRCLNNMGIIHKNRGEYVEALSVYDESISIIITEENPMQIAQGYINMGNVFVFLGNYNRALEYYNLALDIAEREGGEKDYAICLLNTGVVQNKCGNFSEADELYKRALIIGKDIGDPVLISNCKINIGTNYSEMGNLEEGIRQVESGLKIKIELGDNRTISNCYIHLAEIHFKMEEYDKAIELYMKAIPTKESLGDKEGLVRSYLGLSRIHCDRENFLPANQMVDKAMAIAEEINALEHVATAYGIKQDISTSTGDYYSAFQHSMDFHRIRDSLLDENTSKAVMEMEFRHQSKVLEKENENLRIQSTLTTELMKKRNSFLYSIAGITILLAAGLILGAYFLRRLRNSSLKLEEKNLVITKQNLKLDALNRTKDRMMSIIAHDLRGTIGNQLTTIEVLHRVEGSSQKGIDKNKLLGNLKHSASYSLELLENLLHWSRLEENEAYFHPEEIKLSMVVNGCVSLFDETARLKGITIEQKINGEMKIQADRIMIEAIVRNLISNSIKFSEPGGSISIEAKESDSSLHFEVADNGIGMTEDQIDKVLHNGGYTKRGTANEKGAGIGLTLVREFTALHKGQLIIESQPGKGTQMKITFPKPT
jgi:signal transduction histidine kinase/Tfp pilus assembly protein PilF